MKNSGKCPKCGSTNVLRDAKAIDRDHQGLQKDLTIATFTKPDALTFKGQRSCTVSAWVCSACGFLEFYADKPDSLLPGK
jgi:predicted nucleic-acid-binding Zn-ribbon protein